WASAPSSRPPYPLPAGSGTAPGTNSTPLARQCDVKEMVMPDVTGLKLLEIPVVEQTKTTPISTRSAAPSALQLLSFYQSLSHWERIDRFGCAMSDEAIRAWRCSLNPWYSKSILWPHGRRPLGVVEIFGSQDEEWICPEMAVCVLEEAAS